MMSSESLRTVLTQSMKAFLRFKHRLYKLGLEALQYRSTALSIQHCQLSPQLSQNQRYPASEKRLYQNTLKLF